VAVLRGIDLHGLADYILDFSSRNREQRQYAEMHLGRLIRTLELTPRGGPQDAVLEMGAYMQITPALKTKLGYGEVRGSYLGPVGEVEEKRVRSKSGEEFHCVIDLFNAETDRYPYPDGHYAAVLCCELIEHLMSDPMHLVAEVNRILRPGGAFVLSTPNITSLRSVGAVLTGYHPGLYSQYIRPKEDDEEAEPRHAREYTPNEMKQMFEAGGFSVEQLETGPYGLEPQEGFAWVDEVLRENDLPADLRGETIHIAGRKWGPVGERYPAWLYD
jgi:SAM-dependent methyltransferase